MRVLAPAKINLHLRVGHRRDDGFHPLASWMCTVGLFDTLIFERARPGGLTSVQPAGIALQCDRPDLAVDQSNLVVRAASALASAASRLNLARTAETGGWAARLHKRIPAGAGLGGGSSDAARTLLALNRLWEIHAGTELLRELCAALGSDVAFFLDQPSAWCTGRGEWVVRLAPPRCRAAVLLLPPIHVSTPSVYRQFDAMGLGSAEGVDTAGPVRPPESIQGWTQLGAEALLGLLVNDLEAPAFALEPRLAAMRAEAELAVGRPVRMSGSGSSLFTLYDELPEAERAASQLHQRLGIAAVAVAVAPTLADDLDPS